MSGFLLVSIKLLIGFFAMAIIINLSGKGNLAPSSASDQILNYVLGGIIGGVIYNDSVKISTPYILTVYISFLPSLIGIT
nr:hypothetical protein [uncultured Peptostreptococcus sp.]